MNNTQYENLESDIMCQSNLKHVERAISRLVFPAN